MLHLLWQILTLFKDYYFPGSVTLTQPLRNAMMLDDMLYGTYSCDFQQWVNVVSELCQL